MGVSGLPCSPPAFAVRVRCVCPLVPFLPPCSGRGVLFVLVVCSAPVALWSCGSLWRPLFAARVRRPRQVCMPPCPCCPLRVLGVEFCSSSWCVQLLWPLGAVGVSGIPCWPPAFAVLVRCVCPLVAVVPSPVFWARSFVPLGGVLSSCGRLELWESLASPVRRPRSPSASGVYAPLSPLSPRVLGVEFCSSWWCVQLLWPFGAVGVSGVPCSPPAFAVRVRCVCPLVPVVPRVLGVEFCSSSWCVQLLWLPGAMGVSGVPCWRPAFAVRVRCVCPLVPVVPPPCSGRGVLFFFVVCSAPVAAWSCWSLWRPLLAARVRRPRQVCMPHCPLCPPVFWAWSFVRLGGVFSSCGRLELWESLASPVGRPRSPSASGVYAPLSLLFPPPSVFWA